MDNSKELKGDSTLVEQLPSQSEDMKKSEVADSTLDAAPSRSKDLSKTLPEEAFNNFLQGKRHMLVQDYTFAVQSLATACELYVQHFGELALECGEVYFLYGKALFRLSQQQSSSGVLGDAINKVAAEEEEEAQSSEDEDKENESESDVGDDNKEKEAEVNGTEEAADDNEVEAEEKEPSESTDSPQNVEVEMKDSKEKEEEPTVASAADTTLQNESNMEEEQQEPEEDDLELAWNSLETAKTIFKRQGENHTEAQLRIAEIFQLLAEISMESDNYTAAITDLQECLAIQQKHLLPDDRLLAHTYYEMGLAYMLQKSYEEAVGSFRKTTAIFEMRRRNLKNTPVPETVGGFEAAEQQKEIEDIEGILTDIKEKIEDTEELVRNAKNELQEAIVKKEKEIENDFPPMAEKLESSSSSSNNSKPTTNITHLLKRKKPDQDDEKETESKRIKISPNVQNGDSSVC